MIVAAGLTPAWQQILVFQQLRLGHVNRAQQAVWCGSGKVLNVGAALKQLGAESLTISPIGGATGQQIRDDFARRGIPARWVSTIATTRICTTILDQATGATTELIENSAPLTDAELARYADAFAESTRSASDVVFSGSLPQGAPPSFYRSLMERVSARIILDIRGRELIECLPLSPLLVKPNRDELAATVGRSLDTEGDVIAAMSEVRDLGAAWVVVSHGPAPLLVLGESGLHRIEPPPVKALNPIGCGDSLTAAIAAQLARGATPLDAITFGVTYAAQKAAQLLPVSK